MTPRPDRKHPQRLPRAWVPVGLVSAGAAGVGLLAVSLLIETDGRDPVRVHVPSEPGPRPSSVAAVPSGSSPAVAQRKPRAKPTSVKAVLAEDAQITPPELVAWIGDSSLEPQVRYAALRRLEQADPAEAVSAAIALLTETTPLLRLNAIALIGRAKDPRAAAALASLDERSRRLASTLARR